MIPVTQFILGNSDPLLYPSEKMTNSIDEQIAFLQSQKQAINEAREIVEQMYHVKDNKKYIGEKYDMNKAHEICERYKEVLPNDVEPCDVYVAINAQYHDYAKLFEEWFGGNIDNKVFESAITFWFKDVDFDGDKVWEYFHMNN
ncbi:MAG: hypothetical protein [Bacteriophage sp.]|nr:MAG: hypothetical protein [Bacteriophage sp.]